MFGRSFIANLWFLLKLKNRLISSEGLVQLLKLFFLTPPPFYFQAAFFCHLIYALANLSQSQAGKDVFSTIACCQGQGLWFRACRFVAAVKGGGSSRALVHSDMVQWKVWRAWRKWKDFLLFQGLFFCALGMEGEVVFRFQLNMMDQTSWKINTITDAQFVILFIARKVIHSTSCTYVSKNTHTHLPLLLYYMQKHPSSPDTNYSVNKQQDKAQVHVRLNFTLMSWPKVMDCSLLQLQ